MLGTAWPRRLRPLVGAVALTVGAVTSLGRSALGAAAQAVAEAPSAGPLHLGFRFRTGARPAGRPAVAPDGTTYIGTSEGYVHALSAEGSYLWGYTLRGPVTGRVAVGVTSAVLVPTARRIYALRPDGTLLWVFESPIVVQSDLIADGLGRYFFESEDGRLFGLSGRGALVLHFPGQVAFSSPPSLLANGAIAAAHSDGAAVASLAGKSNRFVLGSPARELFSCPSAEFCALVGDELLGIGASGVLFRIPAQRASADGSSLAVVTDARLDVYRGTPLRRELSWELPAAVSAAPAFDGVGRILVPLKNGLLCIAVERNSVSCIKVAASALGTPVLDAPRHRVLVTGVEGLLASVEVD